MCCVYSGNINLGVFRNFKAFAGCIRGGNIVREPTVGFFYKQGISGNWDTQQPRTSSANFPAPSHHTWNDKGLFVRLYQINKTRSFHAL